MRQNGWEQRLWRVTRGALVKPFEYGTNDCAIFAADCVKAITGVDLAAELRGTYSTEAGALKVILQRGCENIEQLISTFLPEMPKEMARRGDLVSVEGIHGVFIAVVDGRTAVGPTPSGIRHTAKAKARMAWRVD